VISDADRPLKEPTTLIDDAHAAGLLVHAYTFRNEDFSWLQNTTETQNWSTKSS
jgi:glycerophosphoryl diester phosphodiesterase